VAAALREAPAGSDDGVWPDNVPAVLAFLAAATQWRTGTAGDRLVWIGLDYAGARAGIEAAGLRLDPAVWEGLRVMEAEARDALNGVAPRIE